MRRFSLAEWSRRAQYEQVILPAGISVSRAQLPLPMQLPFFCQGDQLCKQFGQTVVCNLIAGHSGLLRLNVAGKSLGSGAAEVITRGKNWEQTSAIWLCPKLFLCGCRPSFPTKRTQRLDAESCQTKKPLTIIYDD